MVTFQEIYYSNRNKYDKNISLRFSLAISLFSTLSRKYLLPQRNFTWTSGLFPVRALRLTRVLLCKATGTGAMEHLSSLAPWSGGSWPLNHPGSWLWWGLQALRNRVSLMTDRRAKKSCQACWGLAERPSVWFVITQLLGFISRTRQPEQELHSRHIITSPHRDITLMSITDSFQISKAKFRDTSKILGNSKMISVLSPKVWASNYFKSNKPTVANVWGGWGRNQPTIQDRPAHPQKVTGST